MPSTPEVWRNEFQANSIDSGPGGNDQEDSVVIQLTNGNIVVLYEDNSDSAPAGASGIDIVGQIYDPLGNEIGSEFRANQSFSVDDERNFDAAALEDGGFVVVYEDDFGADTGIAIRATEWTTDDSGVVSNSTITVATSPDADDIVRHPSVDSFSNGDYVVAYEHFDSSVFGGGDYDLRFVVVEADGTVGPEEIGVSGSDSSGADTDVAVLSNGDIALVYDFDTTDDAIAYSVRDTSGGSSTGGRFVANTDSNGDTDTDASIIALDGGGFVISWTNTDASDTDIEFQRYDNDGDEQGGIVTVETGGGSDNDNESHLIALDDGGFVVAYDDDEGSVNEIKFERFNSTGGRVGSVVTVNTDGNVKVDPSGIGLEDGRFVVGWTSSTAGDEDVFVEFYDPRDFPNDPGVYTPEQWVVGTIGNDVFTPAANAEITHGWDGDDVITESGGVREYYGDSGNDTINVVSAINSDLHDGGTGNDTVDWTGASTFVSGATFNLAAGTATLGAASEVMTNFENLNGTSNAETIIGTGGSNSLVGNGGDDTIEGGSGIDTIRGGAGDDSLEGGFSTDSVSGGSGNDTISVLAGEFSDSVDGGADIDTLDLSDIVSNGSIVNLDTETWRLNPNFGGLNPITSIERVLGTQLDDTVIGSSVDETIVGNDGDDSARGSGGDDSVLGGDGDDTLFGNAGDDTLRGGGDDDSLLGAGGEDRMFGDSGDDTLRAGGGDDSVVGGSGDDRLLGDSGNDTVRGQGGDDSLLGGSGDDFMVGDAGEDTLRGGGNDDFLIGGGDDDTLFGDAGADTLRGSLGDDSLRGGGGDDSLFGAENNDTLRGDSGDDTLIGGSGNDSVVGGSGDDTVQGDSGSDTVLGGADDDVVLGGSSSDTLRGDTGDDTIDGGTGSDTIAYTSSSIGSGDVNDGDADTVLNGIGDVLNFTSALEGQLVHDGINLGATGVDVVIDGGGSTADRNIRFTGSEQLQIDVDGDGAFNAGDDFRIFLNGVNSVTYDASADLFLLG
jgi:Ca2+-binding RTX toxin-like protein